MFGLVCSEIILSDRFFINGTLKAQKYLNMLRDQICPAIRAVAEDFGSVIYQHDIALGNCF